MEDSQSTPRKNSVSQLASLYSVVIGIALASAMEKIIVADVPGVPIRLDSVVNLATMLVIMIPFYHGAVRHLYASYVEVGETPRSIKNGALLADFFLLFLEGCMFVLIAVSVTTTLKMAWAIVALLLLDSIWGLLAWLAFANGNGTLAEQKWALINICAATILSAILIASDGLSDPALQCMLLVAVTLRTIVDYSLCWHFYFPDH